MPLHHRASQNRGYFIKIRSFLPLGAALGLVLCHFLPWAQHHTAALTLHGHDLATFTNFTPGAGVFSNEWFYVPLWVGALLLALWAARVNGIWRGALLALALLVASLGFPTYPEILAAYRAPNAGGVDYRLQFYVTLSVMALVAGAIGFGRRLSARAHAIISAVLVCAVAIPLVGYLVIRPFIETLYRDSVGIGAGWWGTLVIWGVVGPIFLWRSIVNREMD